VRIKKDRLLASIDIGSNTIRLLIAEVSRTGEIRELYSESRITRLGEGISKGKGLDPRAIERTVVALKIFKESADRYHLEGLKAVATSAVRGASNKKAFLSVVKKEAGLVVDVLTGRQEATQTLTGVLAGLRMVPPYCLVMDIGGGSTEFILSKDDKAKAIVSMNFGVVPLTERFIKNDPVGRKDLKNLKDAVIGRIKEAKERIRKTIRIKGKRDRNVGNILPEGTMLIGTAGTITTLAAIDQGLERYSFSRVNNYILKKSSVEKIFSRLKTMTLEGRRNIPVLELGREDLILPGSLILLEAMSHFGFREILVSDYGLREGVLINLQKSLSKN
jgi:exopolyphosphatase/guanosine-5'-triphosphate,3'-diphosphate pyrophosphatase